ncbi:MAG: glycosyltransferase family 39 protein [Anaerolineae bacterium]|nr:glycosyltransferase family 39 protein [Anaerolineae bacterium]
MKPFTALMTVLMIAVLLLAFWLRLADLDTLPPGLSTDEAVNVFDAFNLAHSGTYVFYEDEGRSEPLYYGLLALGIRLFGPSVWAGRLVNMFTGTFTVAAAYWAARQCLIDQPRGVRSAAGLAAAGSLAVALGHITLSRGLYRAVIQPPLMLLFAGFLFAGLRSNRRRDLIISGVCLGLVLYTYTAGLVVPGALATAGLSLLVFRLSTWRDWLPQLAIVGIAFVIVAAPLGILALAAPDRVFSRADTVQSDNDVGMWDRVERVWDQLVTAGDINPQYNAAQAPIVPPGFDLLFRLGLLALLIRVRHPASGLIAALVVLSTIPVIGANEIPHGLRIVGEFAAFPLVIAAAVAVGLALLGELLRRVERLPARHTIGGGVIALLVALTAYDGLAARRDYVAYWDEPDIWRVYGRELQHGEWFFRTDQRDWGGWLSDQPGPLLVALDELSRVTTRAWTLDAYPTVTTADDSFTLPANTQIAVAWALETGDLRRDTRDYALLHDGTITILPPLDAATQAALLDASALTRGIDQAPAVRRANGDVMARVQPVAPDLTLAFEPLTVTALADAPLVCVDDDLRLVGWRGPDTLDPDTLTETGPRTLRYTLDWANSGTPDHYYSIFLQLHTQDHDSLGGDEARIWRWLFPPPLWSRGDVVPDPHTFEVPADLPPGAYRLVVGAYLSTYTDRRRTLTGPDGAALGDMTTIGWVKVPQPDKPPPDAGAYPVENAVIAETFALRGADIERDGSGLRLALFWEALADRPAIDATIFIHALAPDGSLIAQHDARPWNGQYPTFIWDAGERVQTDHVLALPDDLPDGTRLVVGMYTYPDITHLPVVQDGSPSADGVITLGTLDDLLKK